MSNENQPVAGNGNVEEPVVDYKLEFDSLNAKYENLLSQVQSVATKNRELLGEKKQLKSNLQEEVDKKTQSIIDDYEARLKSKEDELRQKQEAIRGSKLNILAKDIALNLAEGTNAEILERFVQERLNSEVDEEGNIDSRILEKIKRDFENDKKFHVLFKGTKAAGGGASGNLRSAGNIDTSKLTPMEKIELAYANYKPK